MSKLNWWNARPNQRGYEPARPVDRLRTSEARKEARKAIRALEPTFEVTLNYGRIVSKRGKL